MSTSPPPNDTPHTLLQRLCTPGQTRPYDWRDFVLLYTPMLTAWARQQGFQPTDAEDLAQDVFLTLATKLPNYRRESGRFRNWLAEIARNCCIDFRRRNRRFPPLSDDLGDVAGGWSPTQFDEAESTQAILGQAMALVKAKFGERAFAAFAAVVFDERKPAEVAAEVDMTIAALYSLQYRIMAYLRQIRELLE